jgi:hypothetical protein
MKNKITYLLIAGIFAATLTSAQITEDPREKFDAGIKAGINASNVWNAEGENFRAETKLGIAAGVFAGIPIGKFLGIQPELLLSQKGFQGSGTLLSTNYSYVRTTSYIDIPIQLQLKPLPFFTILIGPQYSYLFHQKDEYHFGLNSYDQEQEFNNENIRKNILGFTGGVDLMYHNMVVSGRAGLDFQANNGNGTHTTPKYQNRWVQFTIGFKL